MFVMLLFHPFGCLFQVLLRRFPRFFEPFDVFCCGMICRCLSFYSLEWISSHCYHEWGESRRRMLSVVMAELSNWQPIYPIVLFLVDIHAEVFFQFLIYSFRLSVHLGMIGRRRVCFDPDLLVEAFHESRYKL